MTRSPVTTERAAPEPAAPAGSAWRPGGFGDWLRLARISNLPTVWTHVLVGGVLARAVRPLAEPAGASIASVPPGSPSPAADGPIWSEPGLWLAAVSVSLLYIAGMILNDVADAPRDAERGLARPIPEGRVGRRIAGVAAVAGMIGGVAVAAAAGVAAGGWALALAAAIVGYDLLKERSAAAIALMGVCRALVAPLAVAATTGAAWSGPAVLVGAVTGVYILLVTIAARGEHDADPERRGRRRGLLAARLMAGIPWASAATGAFAASAAWAARWRDGPDAAVLLAAAAAVGATITATIWIIGARRRLAAGGRVPEAVMRWLAALCVIDAAIILAAGGGVPAAIVAGTLFLVVRAGHRRIAGS